MAEGAIPIASLGSFSPAQRTVLQNLFDLNAGGDWKAKKGQDMCTLEEAAVTYSHNKALRITTDVNCTLATFTKFLGDVNLLRKYDPNLEAFEVVGKEERGTILYTNYKKTSALITPRDFVSICSGAFATADECAAIGIKGAAGGAIIQNTVNGPADLKPEQKGFVRGTIHLYGYIVTAAAPDAPAVKLSCLSCVDPNGSIPGWVIDAAAGENCKKLAMMRTMAEDMQKKAPCPGLHVVAASELK